MIKDMQSFRLEDEGAGGYRQTRTSANVESLVEKLEEVWTVAVLHGGASCSRDPAFSLWHERLERSAKKRARSSIPLFLHFNERHVLNADAAAAIANCKVRVVDVNSWFVAVSWTRRKDLFLALAIHPSTMSRKDPDEELGPEVTERLLRHSDLMVRATEVFGEGAETWLSKPHQMLNERTPLQYASNEYGAAKVRSMLNAIEYGGVV